MKSLAEVGYNELCALRYDHASCSNFTIMTDSEVVWISEQKAGEGVEQHIEISRKVFNRLVEQYTKKKKFVRKVEW